MNKTLKISSLLLLVIAISFAFNSKIFQTDNSGKIGNILSKVLEFDNDASKKHSVWIYFNDKGPGAEQKLSDPKSLVSERSLERRKKVLPENQLVGFHDIPVYQPYVQQLENKVTGFRVKSKWLNAISVEVMTNQIYDIAKLDFVTKIELVEKYKRSKPVEEEIDAPILNDFKDSPLVDSFSYGASLTQMTLIKANIPHNNGIYGQGVIVANFDAGFTNYQTHQSFTTLPMKIWKKKDFHTNDTVTIASHSHGQATLSLVGGYKPGSQISPAFMSTYIICRTEVDPGETPAEMDNWVEAAEWVDSLGADVITSSLGYLAFDSPYPSLTWLDMNGHTASITIAADIAAHNGIAVFNSAGNSGSNSSHNTLGAPADGDSVITIGATTSTGVRASYSSVGPTTDTPPRIKPDIMTQGSGNQVASGTGYSTFGSGTSWACPMAAGVGAQMLSANKNLTPIQVRDILRKFSNNNASPNNQVGWGLIDAEKSVDSARKLDNTAPVILHTLPFSNTPITDSLTFKAKITDNGIIRYTRSNEAPRVYYRKNTGSGWSAWSFVNKFKVSNDTFYFKIPGSQLGTSVEYYLAAQDIALPTSKISTLPAGGSGINPPGSTAPTTKFAFTVGTTGITKETEQPLTYNLFDNYPNPFNPTTKIKFSLPENTFVSLKVYDITGKLVSELINSQFESGVYTIDFSANGISSGTYFYRLSTNGYTQVKKMVLIK
jgi:hypothetical protein